MLRPIEANLSLYNVEQKANQVKDPNAHQFQTMQQNEIQKQAAHQAQSVQPTEKPEGDVKVRERKDDRDRDNPRKKKRGDSFRDQDAAQGDEPGTDEGVSRSAGGLDFLA